MARLLTLADRVRKTGPRPLVALAMGPLGVLTRILAGRYGAPFTFACADAREAVAPGQIDGGPDGRPLPRARGDAGDAASTASWGRDVTRSLSPVLHNRAFAARGLDAVYVPLQAEALEPFVAALPALGLSGFSVTRPYKTADPPLPAGRRRSRPRPRAASTPWSCATAFCSAPPPTARACCAPQEDRHQGEDAS